MTDIAQASIPGSNPNDNGMWTHQWQVWDYQESAGTTRLSISPQAGATSDPRLLSPVSVTVFTQLPPTPQGDTRMLFLGSQTLRGNGICKMGQWKKCHSDHLHPLTALSPAQSCESRQGIIPTAIPTGKKWQPCKESAQVRNKHYQREIPSLQNAAIISPPKLTGEISSNIVRNRQEFRKIAEA